jgi:ribosomal protein L11 methyltransferase
MTADGLDHPGLAAMRFDVILANILAEPLIALAPGLRRALAPGGAVVLSGLLAEQQAAVLAAYEREGLTLRQSWPIDGWVTMWVG